MNKLLELLVVGVVLGVTLCLLSSLMGCRGPEGRQGISVVGPKGDTGNTGANGATGATGVNGTNGTNGTNGADATPVTVVNLCPGVSNYGVFVETAICLNGNLYAVYSIPNAFMTLIAPGNYTSAGIGSACNLTVSPGCIVTH